MSILDLILNSVACFFLVQPKMLCFTGVCLSFCLSETSVQSTDPIVMKYVSQMHLWTTKLPFNIGSCLSLYPDLGSVYGSFLRHCQTG